MKEIQSPAEERAAFIAIVGRPNVGKSSLLNRLVGTKLAIVSKKPQTTRTRIMGVLTEGPVQLVFIDTPGLIKPKSPLGDFMVRSVTQSVAGVDACLLVAEADTPVSKADEELCARFRALGLPAVLAVNKIDLLEDKSKLMAQIASLAALYDFDAVVPVSARDGDGLDILKDELSKLAMPGGHLFPPDTLTDQSERTLAAEMVREKILRFTEQEIPHGVAVVTERMREENGVTHIDCTIYCERAAHKGILIGKGGQMLKKIGTRAREDMERFFDTKINLQLWVKVKEDWRQRPETLAALGFDPKSLED